MSTAIRCINQRFAFKNSGISCLALIFNLSYLKMTILYANTAVAGCETFQLIYLFFSKLTRTHSSVVEASRSESGGSGSIPAPCFNSLPLLCHIAWH